MFPLNRFNRLSDIREAIRNIPYMGAAANTPEAFRQADVQCFNAANGDRDDADNVIIIVTDGVPTPSNRRNPALMEARRLKDKGIEITAVGITEYVDQDFLKGISSGDNYFKVSSFFELEAVKEPMLQQFCPTIDLGEFYFPVMCGFLVWLQCFEFPWTKFVCSSGLTPECPPTKVDHFHIIQPRNDPFLCSKTDMLICV